MGLGQHRRVQEAGWSQTGARGYGVTEAERLAERQSLTGAASLAAGKRNW